MNDSIDTGIVDLAERFPALGKIDDADYDAQLAAYRDILRSLGDELGRLKN
ncbi:MULTISPECIES: hypothetical protein [Bifidobacterium]|uniref:hypothetical protein n=1 Tax=Bifidobacterium TaxID=1678 RepID=UPI0013D18846|nr:MULTISPECIES: hypothetical protein [Bifidobacterium]